MEYFADIFTKPFIKRYHYKKILEIGASFGHHSDQLLETVPDQLTIIDPCFDTDLIKKFCSFIQVKPIKGLSLEILPQMSERFDCVFIDGDHNWYTVYHELKIIHEKNLVRKGGTILLHDVGWPYGRRDMYYLPESIPKEFLHPAAKKGMIQGKSELVAEGFNANLLNAAREGGPHNGVLTAVEDFLKEHHGKYFFAMTTQQYGLGLLVREPSLAKIFFAWRLLAGVDLKHFLRANKKLIFSALTFLYMGVLTYLSIQPAPDSSGASVSQRVLHNLCHIPAYAVLYYLVIESLARFSTKAKVAAFTITILFGAFNEYLQSFVPSRQASFGDILLNGIGALGMMWILRKRVADRV